MKWIPIGNTVLVRETENKEPMTSSGLLLPTSAQNSEKVYTIELIGATCKSSGIAEGQRVMFTDWLGKIGKDLYVVQEEKIIAQFL